MSKEYLVVYQATEVYNDNKIILGNLHVTTDLPLCYNDLERVKDEIQRTSDRKPMNISILNIITLAENREEEDD